MEPFDYKPFFKYVRLYNCLYGIIFRGVCVNVGVHGDVNVCVYDGVHGGVNVGVHGGVHVDAHGDRWCTW
jgi:hypothetical protein